MSNTEIRTGIIEDIAHTARFIEELNGLEIKYTKQGCRLAAQAARESIESWTRRLNTLSNLLLNETKE